MKKLLMLICCMLFCMPLLRAKANEELTIVHVTDMHYLSPSLTDHGDAFMEIIENADGKVTHYTPQIMQAFVDEMLEFMPDAVILSGDLTLNGAKQSHAELAEMLIPLADAGIRVLALPGNHDTNAMGYSFSDQQIIPVEGVPDADFDDLYAKLGYDSALSRDMSSMSYVAELSPDVRCLLVDTNANGTSGTVNKDTLLWIEEQLAAAQREGITVIAVTHQPALIHNSLFTFGYAINNSDQLLALFEKYGVQLSLCGHLHMQHVAGSNGLTEIAASSLAVSPNQYGVLRVQDGMLAGYSTQALDVAEWAERNGLDDVRLLAFSDYAADFFDRTTFKQAEAVLAGSSISAAEQRRMADFAVSLNAEYFSGRRTMTAEHPDWTLWQKYLPDAFFTHYLRSILAEPPKDMNTVVFQESID